MDARTKAVKTHRKRLRSSGMKRVEVTVPSRDAKVVRDVALVLRNGGAPARRLTSTLRQITGGEKEPTIAEVMDSLPDISGPEFDAVFEEIERFRHDPVANKLRDVDL
jgi:hypothetical protein